LKVLVTGVAGFIGSSLAEQLLARGDEVAGIDNFHDYYSPERKRQNVAPLLESDKFTLFEKDFSLDDDVTNVFSNFTPDAVAHLGAMANVRYSVKHPKLFTRGNVVGTSNLLEACRANDVPHFVFASTSSVYGQRTDVPFYETDATDKPLAPYPATKKAGELLGHAYHNMYGMTFTGLRFFNVYGPKGRPDMMPYIVTERLRSGETIQLFDAGEMYRDWTFVQDIVAGIVAALDTPVGCEMINLGRGEPVSMKEFMSIVQEVIGKEANIENVPAPASEPKQTYACIEKAKELLGYSPSTSFQDGYKAFWGWYQEHVMTVKQ
jgi:UDP-glucuronate 4-epimerase